jgi:hypothetical protein
MKQASKFIKDEITELIFEQQDSQLFSKKNSAI